MTTPTDPISKEEFVRRFADELVRIVGPSYWQNDDEGEGAGRQCDTREYALEVGPTYFDDPDQRDHGPEECASSDHSYWEEA